MEPKGSNKEVHLFPIPNNGFGIKKVNEIQKTRGFEAKKGKEIHDRKTNGPFAKFSLK